MTGQLGQLLAALGAMATLSPLLNVYNAIPNYRPSSANENSQAVSDAQTLVSTQIDATLKHAPRSLSKKRSVSSTESNHQDATDVVENFRCSKNSVSNKRLKISVDKRTGSPFEGGQSASGLSGPKVQSRQKNRQEIDSFQTIPSSDATLFPASNPSSDVPVSQDEHRSAANARSTTPLMQETLPSALAITGEARTISKNKLARTLSTEIDTAETRCQGSLTDYGQDHISPQTFQITETDAVTVRKDNDREEGKIGMENEPGNKRMRTERCEDVNGSGEDEVLDHHANEDVDVAVTERRSGVDGVLETEKFESLAQKEEDEGSVSLDMSFIWGSLPDSESSFDP